VTTTAALALIFAGLLGLEWRYRRRSLRLVSIMLALVVWWLFGGPNYTIAGRRASAASAEERIRVLRGDTLPPYFAGVDIMREYLLESEEEGAGPRRLALGVLVWLACTPVFRREASTREAAHATESA
jgi:hypothetical protein